MTQLMHEAIAKRIPSLMDSATRVYGPEAYLFGIDLGLHDYGLLCDEISVHEYERNEGLMHDGLKIQPSTTLEPGEINAVVFFPNQLVVRKTTLEPT